MKIRRWEPQRACSQKGELRAKFTGQKPGEERGGRRSWKSKVRHQNAKVQKATVEGLDASICNGE